MTKENCIARHGDKMWFLPNCRYQSMLKGAIKGLLQKLDNFGSTTIMSAKRRLLRKKYNKHLLSSFQKTKMTQSSGSVFADRIEQGKKTNFELELTKIVDCFLDGHGNYTTNSKSSELKSL